MEGLIQFFVDWGYWGMALGALLAGSIVPIGSEVIYVILLKMGLDPVLLTLSATLGNTLGGMTCYWVGERGDSKWLHKYLGISEQRLEKATKFLKGRGAIMGFFAFLPYIGEAIAVVLGIMRSNQAITATSMFVGKAIRYTALYFATAVF